MEYALALVVLLGLFLILPNRIEIGTVDDKLLQMEFVLSYDDRMEIIERLKAKGLGNNNVFCSACSSAVEISFLRRAKGEQLENSTCLPCFLHNHTDVSQEEIDDLVKVADEQGWYLNEDHMTERMHQEGLE